MLLAEYYSGDKTKKNEVGWACGMYWGEERWIQGYNGETRGTETTCKTLGTNGKIILKLILKKHDGKHRLD
jgi:hypothetical protein